MSQVASAYLVPPAQLAPLDKLADAGDYRRFWELLRQNSTAVEPAYGHSGYVVAVLGAYLEEAGVSLPLGEENEAISDLLEGEVSLLLAASDERAGGALADLEKLPLDVDRLGAYFAEFTGEEWPEAGAAMLEAVEFLRVGLRQVLNTEAWLLVFVG